MGFKDEIRGRGANDGNARDGKNFPAPLRGLGFSAADGEQVEMVLRAQAHVPEAFAHPDARHGYFHDAVVLIHGGDAQEFRGFQLAGELLGGHARQVDERVHVHLA